MNPCYQDNSAHWLTWVCAPESTSSKEVGLELIMTPSRDQFTKWHGSYWMGDHAMDSAVPKMSSSLFTITIHSIGWPQSLKQGILVSYSCCNKFPQSNLLSHLKFWGEVFLPRHWAKIKQLTMLVSSGSSQGTMFTWLFQLLIAADILLLIMPSFPKPITPITAFTIYHLLSAYDSSCFTLIKDHCDYSGPPR